MNLETVQAPSLIIPSGFKLFHKSLLLPKGNERITEKNSECGGQGFQILIWNRLGKRVKRLEFDRYQECFEMFLELNDPDFDSRVLNIDPIDVDKFQLFITQALTSFAGNIRQFTIPLTWGTPNSIKLIGGGSFGDWGIGSLIETVGGGGGAFASGTNKGYARGVDVNYRVGDNNNNTLWNGTTTGNAQMAAESASDGNADTNTVGRGGRASASTGDIKFSGGSGNTIFGTAGNSIGGASGGSAAGPSGDGTTPADGAFNNLTGTDGASSATAAGGAHGVRAGNINGQNGSNGTDFDITHGAGAGGGGGAIDTGFTDGGLGGNAGNYGAGAAMGAYLASHGDADFGDPSTGIVFLSWSPFIYSEVYSTS